MKICIVLKKHDAEGYGGEILEAMGMHRSEHSPGVFSVQSPTPSEANSLGSGWTQPEMWTLKYLEALTDAGIRPMRVFRKEKNAGLTPVHASLWADVGDPEPVAAEATIESALDAVEAALDSAEDNRKVEASNPSLWLASEADEALGEAYRKLIDLKLSMDQMEEVPKSLQGLYNTVRKAMGLTGQARKETTQARGLSRRLASQLRGSTEVKGATTKVEVDRLAKKINDVIGHHQIGLESRAFERGGSHYIEVKLKGRIIGGVMVGPTGAPEVRAIPNHDWLVDDIKSLIKKEKLFKKSLPLSASTTDAYKAVEKELWVAIKAAYIAYDNSRALLRETLAEADFLESNDKDTKDAEAQVRAAKSLVKACDQFYLESKKVGKETNAAAKVFKKK